VGDTAFAFGEGASLETGDRAIERAQVRRVAELTQAPQHLPLQNQPFCPVEDFLKGDFVQPAGQFGVTAHPGRLGELHSGLVKLPLGEGQLSEGVGLGRQRAADEIEEFTDLGVGGAKFMGEGQRHQRRLEPIQRQVRASLGQRLMEAGLSLDFDNLTIVGRQRSGAAEQDQGCGVVAHQQGFIGPAHQVSPGPIAGVGEKLVKLGRLFAKGGPFE